MYNKFINNYNIDHIPIGPQASLIEDVSELNNMIPYQYTHGRSEQYNHLPLIDFGVTKKFRWKNGSLKNAKILKDILIGVYQGKGSSIGNIKNVFLREERNGRGYYVNRFKRSLFRIDNTLERKRYDGSVWLEDGEELESVRESLFNDVKSIFKTYEEYCEIMNMKLEYHYSEDRDEYTSRRQEILSEMWKFEEETNHLMFVENSDLSTITLFHMFKNVNMNVFVQEETNPILTFPIGNIIGAFKISLNNVFLAQIGSKQRNRYYSQNTKFWYKPPIQGIKHPFLQWMSQEAGQTYITNPDKWTPSWSRNSSVCFGNMSYLYGNEGKLNLVKWIETAWNWMSSFRIHSTNPLNPINLSYYGHPENISTKYHSLYIDLIGVDTNSCQDRLVSYVRDINERRSICDTVCKKDIMKICNGYKADTILLRQLKFKNDIKENVHSLQIVKGWKQPQTETVGNIEWIHDYNEESSLEEDMLEWVNNHNT